MTEPNPTPDAAERLGHPYPDDAPERLAKLIKRLNDDQFIHVRKDVLQAYLRTALAAAERLDESVRIALCSVLSKTLQLQGCRLDQFSTDGLVGAMEPILRTALAAAEEAGFDLGVTAAVKVCSTRVRITNYVQADNTPHRGSELRDRQADDLARLSIADVRAVSVKPTGALERALSEREAQARLEEAKAWSRVVAAPCGWADRRIASLEVAAKQGGQT